MEYHLPLDEMTTAEKLHLMEILWQDLSRNPGDIPSPAWHGEVLAERAKKVQNGEARFVSLEEMRERLDREMR